jgi:hypothetical protein
VCWLAADVFVFESDFSGAWFKQAGDGAKRGRLARAIRADERDDFTLLDVQRNAGQGFDRAIVYGNVFEREHVSYRTYMTIGPIILNLLNTLRSPSDRS